MSSEKGKRRSIIYEATRSASGFLSGSTRSSFASSRGSQRALGYADKHFHPTLREIRDGAREDLPWTGDSTVDALPLDTKTSTTTTTTGVQPNTSTSERPPAPKYKEHPPKPKPSKMKIITVSPEDTASDVRLAKKHAKKRSKSEVSDSNRRSVSASSLSSDFSDIPSPGEIYREVLKTRKLDKDQWQRATNNAHWGFEDDMLDSHLKLIVIGRPGIGKTSLCNAFCGKTVDMGCLQTKPTIAFDMHCTEHVFSKHGKSKYYCSIYDMAGNLEEEALSSYAAPFVKQSDCVILVYDSSSEKCRELDYYQNKDQAGRRLIELAFREKKPLVLVGTKFDLIANDPKKIGEIGERIVDFSDYFESHGIKFDDTLVTSVKSGTNVKKSFETVMEICIKYKVEHKTCLCNKCVHIYDAFVGDGNLKPYFLYKRRLEKMKELKNNEDKESSPPPSLRRSLPANTESNKKNKGNTNKDRQRSMRGNQAAKKSRTGTHSRSRWSSGSESDGDADEGSDQEGFSTPLDDFGHWLGGFRCCSRESSSNEGR
jgi:GTPase SAR1 family protein